VRMDYLSLCSINSYVHFWQFRDFQLSPNPFFNDIAVPAAASLKFCSLLDSELSWELDFRWLLC
jgi:hypothetical protein